jgi:hypothetical protein
VIDRQDVERRRKLATEEAIIVEAQRRTAEARARTDAINEWQAQSDREFEEFRARGVRDYAKSKALEAAAQAAPSRYFSRKALDRKIKHITEAKAAEDAYSTRLKHRHEQLLALRSLGFKWKLLTREELSAWFRPLVKELFTKYDLTRRLATEKNSRRSTTHINFF